MKTKEKDYTVDIHELVTKEVCSHMKPFIEVTMHEHERTRAEVHELREVVKKSFSRRHEVIQDVFIAILLVGMVLFLSAC